jgi:hypothetical protein
MEVRTVAQDGPAVPAWAKMAPAIQQQLQRQREEWRQRLAQDPSCFGEVEHAVHQSLQQTADQIVAGLLAEVGQEAALEHAGKKSH